MKRQIYTLWILSSGLFILFNVVGVKKLYSKSSSVLSSGDWFTLSTSENGVYKIDHSFIKENMDLGSTPIAFDKVGIFGNGGGMLPEKNSAFRYTDLTENHISIHDANNNNRWDTEDYILFYGQSPHTWSLVNDRFEHQTHLYDDKTVYFFTPDKGTHKHIPTSAPIQRPPNFFVDQFDDYAFHELEQTNLIQSGREWYGDYFNKSKNSKRITFNFPNIVSGSIIHLKSKMISRGNTNTFFQVSLNGSTVLTHNVAHIAHENYLGRYARTDIRTGTANASSDKVILEYTLTNPSNSKQAWLDYAIINATRKLIFTGTSMSFRSLASMGTNRISKFTLSNTSSHLYVWDVSHPTKAINIPLSQSASNTTFTTNTDSLKEFIAFLPEQTNKPTYIAKIDNQNIKSIDQAKMIIVSARPFLPAAHRLAIHRQNKSGINVSVIPLEHIYNEFSSGKKDVTAIRDMLSYFYTHNTEENRPKYLLLMGDGTYDPKDRVPNNNNFIPTYQSKESLHATRTYVSDDYFGLLENNEGASIHLNNQSMDVAIGRLPVSSLEEANHVIDKIIRYESDQTLGPWRNEIAFIADDEDGTIHINDANQIASNIEQRYPTYNVDKIFLDAYPQVSTSAGQRYPEVNQAIQRKIAQGALIMNYTGHGGNDRWAQENIFNARDIQQLKNNLKMPLFVTATCEFSRYDDTEQQSAGELLVLNKDGGAIAMVTTVRIVFSSQNFQLNKAFFNFLFEPFQGRTPTLGEVMLQAKNSISGGDNNRKFTLLGDPSMKLNYPKYRIVNKQINGDTIGSNKDTLKALSKVTIKGEVQDLQSNKMNHFNGFVYPHIFDKPVRITTLKNDAQSNVYSFNLTQNTIYKGKASVRNGSFEYTFIVPKDINYQLGAGKLSYYAHSLSQDAQGIDSNIVIGGSADEIIPDNKGPMVAVYMNDTFFVSGGITNPNPILYVRLFDKSGINVSGNSLGHDLTAIIDQDNTNPISLNNHYTALVDNFQQGEVYFPLFNVKDGEHHIEVRAWDAHNNLGKGQTRFVVASSEQIAIERVLNYPNPFKNLTTFSFQHNKAGEPIDIEISIFSMQGVLVKTLRTSIVSEGFVNNLQWDGQSDNGRMLESGTYVYKVKIQTRDGISKHKFEKLVLLR